jgi:hypothetical protein
VVEFYFVKNLHRPALELLMLQLDADRRLEQWSTAQREAGRAPHEIAAALANEVDDDGDFDEHTVAKRWRASLSAVVRYLSRLGACRCRAPGRVLVLCSSFCSVGGRRWCCCGARAEC